MGIRIYTEKVKVTGSQFEYYAIMSKLSDNWSIKHLRFIDPVIDDDGNIYSFVRKDHIIFIAGLAVSVKSLAEFLDGIEREAHTDHPASVYIKRAGDDPLETLLRALEKIEVVSIHQKHTSLIEILPKEEKRDSPWSTFYNLIVDVGYAENDIEFEDELTDF